MTNRVALLAMALAILPTGAMSQGSTQYERRSPQVSRSLLGIDGPNRKVSDSRNGRKRIIYDADGRRDYRRDFAPKDQKKRLQCQQTPGSIDCIGYRF